MTLTDETPLEKALTAACEFAYQHGVEPALTPLDFGIQRSDSGLTTATYINADHAVSVTLHRHGEIKCAVAELGWLHDEADEERDMCDQCEMVDPRGIVDVPLPVDDAAEVPA